MFDIEFHREMQYAEFQQLISAPEPIKLMKCAGCFDEVEESEISLCKMHDVNDGRELEYCNTCIQIYKEDNL